jgi:hypothetical protein
MARTRSDDRHGRGAVVDVDGTARRNRSNAAGCLVTPRGMGQRVDPAVTGLLPPRTGRGGVRVRDVAKPSPALVGCGALLRRHTLVRPARERAASGAQQQGSEQDRVRRRRSRGARDDWRAPAAAHRCERDAEGGRVAARDRSGPAPSPSGDDSDLREGRSRRAQTDRASVAGGVAMSPLRQSLADYLAMRRALGYQLDRQEKLLD